MELFLFGLVVVLGLLVWLVGVPIFLLIRSRRIDELSERLDRLEHAFQRLRRLGVEEATALPTLAEAQPGLVEVQPAKPATAVTVEAPAPERPAPAQPRFLEVQPPEPEPQGHAE